MADVKVLLLGDDPLALGGLATLLDRQPGVTVGGQVALESASARAVQSFAADVLAVDLGPVSAGLDRLRDLAGNAIPALAIVNDEASGPEALAAGARGALLRDSEPRQLAAALVAIARGLVVVDESLVETALRLRATAAPAAEPLTPRELEVLQLLAQGLPNKLIAHRLGVSEHTAKFHVNAILSKLGVQSRTEAVVRAARLGLVIL